jgi:hypothetical protein
MVATFLRNLLYINLQGSLDPEDGRYTSTLTMEMVPASKIFKNQIIQPTGYTFMDHKHFLFNLSHSFRPSGPRQDII